MSHSIKSEKESVLELTEDFLFFLAEAEEDFFSNKQSLLLEEMIEDLPEEKMLASLLRAVNEMLSEHSCSLSFSEKKHQRVFRLLNQAKNAPDFNGEMFTACHEKLLFMIHSEDMFGHIFDC